MVRTMDHFTSLTKSKWLKQRTSVDIPTVIHHHGLVHKVSFISRYKIKWFLFCIIFASSCILYKIKSCCNSRLGIFLIHGSPVFNNVHFFLKACLHIIWQVIVLTSLTRKYLYKVIFNVKRSLLLCSPFSLHQDGEQSTLYLLKRYLLMIL